jgi:DNA-binding MarR family transcriptional regulator
MVSLTDQGQALIERSVDAVLGREAWLVGGLPADERALLAGLLEKLAADVGRRASGESPA